MSTDDRFKFLCHANEVTPGQARRVTPAGYPPIAVYNVGGSFYATNDFCTHGKASLSEGFIDGEIVECPFHGGQFNIRSGAPVMAPCVVPVRTWPLVVQEGRILLDSRPS